MLCLIYKQHLWDKDKTSAGAACWLGNGVQTEKGKTMVAILVKLRGCPGIVLWSLEIVAIFGEFVVSPGAPCIWLHPWLRYRQVNVSQVPGHPNCSVPLELIPNCGEVADTVKTRTGIKVCSGRELT